MDQLDLTVAMLGSIAGIAVIATLLMTLLVKQVLWPEGGAQQDRFAGFVTVIIAIALALVGDLILADPPDVPADLPGKIAYDVVTGLLAGLVAVGGYTATKRFMER